MRFSALAALMLFPVLSADLSAQIVATLPTGFVNTVGAGVVGDPFSAQPFQRFQYCHESLRGTPLAAIVALNFRRDKGFSRPMNTARNVTVSVAMGHGSVGAFDEEFDRNFTVNRTQAVASRVISLPNTFFAQNGANVPEPWSCRIPLDAPFSYDGQHALILDITSNSSNGGYQLESSLGGGAGVVAALSTGSTTEHGCRATGRGVEMEMLISMWSHCRGEMMRLETDLAHGPSAAPAWLNVSTTDPVLSVPGLCGTLRALPTIQIPLGVTDATGRLQDVFLRLPFVPALTTGDLFMQAFAFDPGQAGIPLALSNGQQCRWPAPPAATPTHALIATQTPTATRATRIDTGGVAICGLEQ